MPTLLSLDVSPRGDRSISRALGKRFVEHWKQNNHAGNVIYRDLNASRIPYMDNDWIAGVYAPADVERTPDIQKALALSAELIEELQAADVLFISTPMPGMLENKKARLTVVSRDSYNPGEPSEAADLVSPVLRKALNFIGIEDVKVVRAGGSLAVNLGIVRIEDHLMTYETAIAKLAGG